MARSILPTVPVSTVDIFKNSISHAKYVFTDPVIILLIVSLASYNYIGAYFFHESKLNIYRQLIGFFLSNFIIGVTLLRINSILTGEKLLLSEIFSTGFKRSFLSVVLSLILGLLIGIGLIFLLIPGFMAGFFLFLSPIAFWLENGKFFDAFKISYQLTSLHWQQTFGTIALLGLLLIPVVLISTSFRYHMITFVFLFSLYGLFSKIMLIEFYYNAKNTQKITNEISQ